MREILKEGNDYAHPIGAMSHEELRMFLPNIVHYINVSSRGELEQAMKYLEDAKVDVNCIAGFDYYEISK